MSLRISVITVVLNGANTIERTIKSVLEQDYHDLEYIIIDGGSVDGTVDIIRKYGDYITYWISEPDGGLYYAMNKGLDVTTGDYVYFLNSGDMLLRDVIRRIVFYLEDGKTDALYGNVISRNSGKEIPPPIDVVYRQIPMCHQALFVKKNAIGKYDTSYYITADYKMVYELYLNNRQFLYVPIDIAFYEGNGVSDNVVDYCREVASVSCEMLDTSMSGFHLRIRQIVDFYIDNNYEIMMRGYDTSGLLADFLKDYKYIYERFVIFGAGRMAKSCRLLIRLLADNVLYIADNDAAKWGSDFEGIEIASPKRLKNEKNICILIMNEKNCEEIKMQLDDMKLDETVWIEDYFAIKERFTRKYAQMIIEKGKKEVRGLKELLENQKNGDFLK